MRRLYLALLALLVPLMLAGCTTAGTTSHLASPAPSTSTVVQPTAPATIMSPASAIAGSPASAPLRSPASTAIAPPVPIAVSPTGDWVATGLDGLTLVDRTGASRRPFAGAFAARRLSWSPAGDWLLAAEADGHVLLVHPADGRLVDLAGQLPGLGDAWPLPTWSPDGTRVLVTAHAPDRSSGDPIWEVTPATGAVRKVWQSGSVVGLYGLADDRALLLRAAGCCGAQATLLDLKTGAVSDLGHNGSHAVTPDGRVLAHASYMNGEVTIRDIATAEEARVARPADTARYRLWVNSFSPDSRFLAATLDPGDQGDQGERHTLQLIDRTGAEPTRSISDFAGTLVWVGAHHDFIYATHVGDGLAMHINERTIATHQGSKYLGLMSDGPIAVRSPDGRRVAYAIEMAAHESLLVVVDVTTGEVQTLPDSTGLTPLTWTADGAGLIVADMAFTRTDLGGGLATEGWAPHQIKMVPVTRGN